jgi:hypothetical protein
LHRAGYGGGGVLGLGSSFGELVALWLSDLELRELAEGTKERYRDQVRLHVLPALEQFNLGQITTGRVEWFLKSQAAASPSRAKQSRTMLNLLFGFALRHDALSRNQLSSAADSNPVEGTSQLRTPENQPRALALGRSRPSARRPRSGAPSRGTRDRSRTAWSATSSRSCSGRRCAPEVLTLRRATSTRSLRRHGGRRHWHGRSTQGCRHNTPTAAEVVCLHPADPGTGVCGDGAPPATRRCTSRANDFRESNRPGRSARTTSGARSVSSSRPSASRTRASAYAGIGAPGRS